MQGPLKQDLYHLRTPSIHHISPHTFTTSIQPTIIWHHKLGHPSSKIMKHLADNHHIPIKSPTFPQCNSCQCAKSHNHLFSNHHLTSTKPLELIYSDVWGPTLVSSLDGYLYYVVFVDHFSKYVWFYPMKNKSDVFNIFIQFKSIVEKKFALPIVSLFFDNGGEFIKLKPLLTTHGISHFTTPPHTLEVNGTTERRHRHIVETVVPSFNKPNYLLNSGPLPSPQPPI